MAIPEFTQPETQIPGQQSIPMSPAAMADMVAEQRRVACLDYAVKTTVNVETASTSFILDRAASFENYVVHGRQAEE